VVLDLLDSADGLAGEDLAQVDLLAFVTDAPACSDGHCLVMEGVIKARQQLPARSGI